MIKIKILGIEKLQDRISNAQEKLDAELRKGIEISAGWVLRQMQSNTPVDTGNLKSSEKIDIAGNGFSALIGPNEEQASYAKFVEYGHHTRSGSWVPGQFYVEKTALETRNAVIEIFRDIIKSLIK